MQTEELTVFQPNIITQARYNFSEYEMKVLVYVIKRIQDRLNKDSLEFNKTLFNELDFRIQFNLSEMLFDEGDSKHQSRVRKALVDLASKRFEVDNEKHWFNVGFINYGRYVKETKKWELQVSFLLMPYMASMAKGWTAFELSTILRLNSNTQRLYLMFCQFQGTGIFRIKAEDLRFKLGLEDKYKRYPDFKLRIITAGIKEINDLYVLGQAEIFVKLEQDKKIRGEDEFERLLEFKIVSSKHRSARIEASTAYMQKYCHQILKSIFPEDIDFANRFLDLALRESRLKELSDKLEKREDIAEKEGKALSSYAPLVKHIAKTDFNFQFTKGKKQ